MSGDTEVALIYIAAAVAVGYSIPVLVMIRILVGRRMREGALASILIEQLIWLKIIISSLAFYRYTSLVDGELGRVPAAILEFVYALLFVQGTVTIYRVGKWWLDMRAEEESGRAGDRR